MAENVIDGDEIDGGGDRNGGKRLTCADKFGRAVELDGGSVRCDLGSFGANGNGTPGAIRELQQRGDIEGLFHLFDPVARRGLGGGDEFLEIVGDAEVSALGAILFTCMVIWWGRRSVSVVCRAPEATDH